MKLKHLFLLIILVAGTSSTLSAGRITDHNNTSTPISEIDGDIIIHTVAKGETVYSIAPAYNVSVQEIYKLNPGVEKGIKEGSKLRIPKNKKPSDYSSHLIEPKETLYSVSRMYNISVEDIKNANPSLDENTFRAGMTIRIPIFKNDTIKNETSSRNGYGSPFLEHKVMKGETLYSISKNYNISIETLLNGNPSLKEGLKEGMTLLIPRKQIEPPMDTDVVNNSGRIQSNVLINKEEVLKIGVLLPFLDDKGSIQKEKIIEYYQGFLLAVKNLKEKGLNAEIYTFNIGSEKDTKRLNELLGTTELSNLNLIIGGTSKQQIDILSNYCKKTGTKYVIPFESKNTGVESNPSVFQITTSHLSLYSEITSAFADRFRGYNIVFVSELGSNNDKSDFVAELKKELSRSGIQFKNIVGTDNFVSDIDNALSSSSKNILIPTSSSESSLRRLTGALKASLNQSSVSLFGYPEWQTYTQLSGSLYQYDAYIYSIFFLDEQQKEVIEFSNQYKKWYNADLINSYPRFAYLGYDTGLFFLTALDKYRGNLDANISQLRVPTLQSAIHFKQVNSKGGFINNGLYFIHYNANQTIDKIDISK